MGSGAVSSSRFGAIFKQAQRRLEREEMDGLRVVSEDERAGDVSQPKLLVRIAVLLTTTILLYDVAAILLLYYYDTTVYYYTTIA